jgi:hypothetical protein
MGIEPVIEFMNVNVELIQAVLLAAILAVELWELLQKKAWHKRAILKIKRLFGSD